MKPSPVTSTLLTKIESNQSHDQRIRRATDEAKLKNTNYEKKEELNIRYRKIYWLLKRNSNRFGRPYDIRRNEHLQRELGIIKEHAIKHSQQLFNYENNEVQKVSGNTSLSIQLRRDKQKKSILVIEQTARTKG